MVSSYVLDLSLEAVRLFRRDGGGLVSCGKVDLSEPQIGARLAKMRKTIQPEGELAVDVVIPDVQILYLRLSRENAGHAAVEETLRTTTPYDPEDLSWSVEGETAAPCLAATTRQTLSEAREFAAQHGFAPARLIARPPEDGFPAEMTFPEDGVEAGDVAPSAAVSTASATDAADPVSPEADHAAEAPPASAGNDSSEIADSRLHRPVAEDPAAPAAGRSAPRTTDPRLGRTRPIRPKERGMPASGPEPAPETSSSRFETRDDAETRRVVGTRQKTRTRRRAPMVAAAVAVVAAVAVGGGVALTLRDTVSAPELAETESAPIAAQEEAPREIAAVAPRPRAELPPPDIAPRAAPEQARDEPGNGAAPETEDGAPELPRLEVTETLPEAEPPTAEQAADEENAEEENAEPVAEEAETSLAEAAPADPPAGTSEPQAPETPTAELAEAEPAVQTEAAAPAPLRDGVDETPDLLALAPLPEVDELSEPAGTADTPESGASPPARTAATEAPPESAPTETEAGNMPARRLSLPVFEAASDAPNADIAVTQARLTFPDEGRPEAPAATTSIPAADTGAQENADLDSGAGGPGSRPPPRPRERPAANPSPAVEEDLGFASTAPESRPPDFAALARQARAQTSAASTGAGGISPPLEDGSPAGEPNVAVQPSEPSPASVSRQATIDDAIQLNRLNLVGVYGSSSNRRALVRLPTGRYQKVQVGDTIDGGRIAEIESSELRYVKDGRSVTLSVPQG